MTDPNAFQGARLTFKDVQFLKKLKIEKFREETESFLAEGRNLCLEALESVCEIRTLIYDVNKAEELSPILEKAAARHVPVITGTSKQFRQFTSTVTPPGIAAHITWRRRDLKDTDLSEFRHILALDRVSDPGNMGTLLRTAEWFGIPAVICGKNSIEVTNPKVIRGSMGSLFSLRIWEDVPVGEMIPVLKNAGFTIAGTDTERGAGNLEKLKDLSRVVLILGNEAHGMSSELKMHCDLLITVPGGGKTESLNVAVAGGVLMFCLTQGFNPGS